MRLFIVMLYICVHCVFKFDVILVSFMSEAAADGLGSQGDATTKQPTEEELEKANALKLKANECFKGNAAGRALCLNPLASILFKLSYDVIVLYTYIPNTDIEK